MSYPWQQSQWQLVRKLLTAERLPHAMMLVGNDGLGKADFARELAAAVLCQQPNEDSHACGHCKSCQLLQAGTHPDLHQLEPTAPATSKSANPVLSIRIDDIRALCGQLNQTSQFGRFRVALLQQAEYLNNAAANSLLKTLEEPGQDVLILMVTARPHRLPATIRSRCQVLRLATPDDATALQWLQQNKPADINDSQLSSALKQAQGSPLTALQNLHQLEHQQLLNEAMTASISGKNSLDYAVKLCKFAKLRTLEGMLLWTSDLSRLQSCGPDSELVNDAARGKLQAIANRAEPQRVFRFYDQLIFNISHSAIAVNEQLLWENLLLSWDNL